MDSGHNMTGQQNIWAKALAPAATSAPELLMAVDNAADESTQLSDISGWFDLPFECAACLVRAPAPKPETVLAHLSLAERIEAQRILDHKHDKFGWQGWCGARMALAHAVEKLGRGGAEGFQISKTEQGAPRLHAPKGSRSPEISLAHSAGLGAAAAAEGIAGLGLDVELTARFKQPVPLLHQIASLAERRLVTSMPDDVAAVVLWTLKEAAAKASRMGLGGAPEGFVVAALQSRTGNARVEHQKMSFQAQVRLIGQGAVALAWDGEPATSSATA